MKLDSITKDTEKEYLVTQIRHLKDTGRVGVTSTGSPKPC